MGAIVQQHLEGNRVHYLWTTLIGTCTSVAGHSLCKYEIPGSIPGSSRQGWERLPETVESCDQSAEYCAKWASGMTQYKAATDVSSLTLGQSISLSLSPSTLVPVVL